MNERIKKRQKSNFAINLHIEKNMKILVTESKFQEVQSYSTLGNT